MRVSTIVPVYNNPKDLPECLSALTASSIPDSEIIVVDDGSTDDTASVAARAEVRVLSLARNSGVSAARNRGARQARGDILFFVDADVVVAPGVIRRVADLFEKRPELSAVFGSYDARPRAKGLVSQYRNLLHHFVHQNGNPQASTFWAGCGAVRRSEFEEVGGFDEERFPRCMEDVELGHRLRKAGRRILLDKGLQGTHLKHWDLISMIRTDVLCRAIPWARLILESGPIPRDLNLRMGQRVSFGLVALAGVFLALALLRTGMLALAAAALLGVIVLNRNLYAFFYRRGGLLFCLGCVLLHLLYYLYSGLAYLYVWIGVQLRPATRPQPEK
jgi:GT2 family glycosyltransferase